MNDEFSTEPVEILRVLIDQHGNPVRGDDKEKIAVAMATMKEQGGVTASQYFIKYHGYGPNTGMPLNPLETTNFASLSVEDRAGRLPLVWRRVKKTTFDLYLSYLKEPVQNKILTINRMREDA